MDSIKRFFQSLGSQSPSSASEEEDENENGESMSETQGTGPSGVPGIAAAVVDNKKEEEEEMVQPPLPPPLSMDEKKDQKSNPPPSPSPSSPPPRPPPPPPAMDEKKDQKSSQPPPPPSSSKTKRKLSPSFELEWPITTMGSGGGSGSGGGESEKSFPTKRPKSKETEEEGDMRWTQDWSKDELLLRQWARSVGSSLFYSGRHHSTNDYPMYRMTENFTPETPDEIYYEYLNPRLATALKKTMRTIRSNPNLGHLTLYTVLIASRRNTSSREMGLLFHLDENVRMELSIDTSRRWKPTRFLLLRYGQSTNLISRWCGQCSSHQQFKTLLLSSSSLNSKKVDDEEPSSSSSYCPSCN
jgi:hypothetical protein